MDYKELGLLIGLELHQQLDGHKLFCKCPCIIKDTKPNYEIKRKLRVSASELGDFDPAALYELQKGKYFVYQGYKNINCLVELDENPPEELNQNALKIALQVSLLLNAKPVDNVQFMRKIVIDGSNVSGFQRTALIATDGYIETAEGKVRIPTICLEEESAKKIEDTKEYRKYNISRLCIPLIEIATAPDIHTPLQAKETAEKIGMVLRSIDGIKRGLGSIRQDVNLSIKNGPRVEIKGFQEPGMMIKTTDLEIKRQGEEIGKGKKTGEVRNAKEDGSTEFLRPLPGEARMYPETDLPLLKIGRQQVNEIKKKLPKLRTEIRDELKKKGLNDELIVLVLDNNKVDELETLLKLNKDANLIAKMIILWPSEFATKLKKSYDEIREILSERNLEIILENLRKNKINEGDVKGIMLKVANGTDVNEAVKIERVDDNQLEEEIAGIIKEKPGLRAGGYMGLVIAKLGANVDKRKAMEILNRLVK